MKISAPFLALCLLAAPRLFAQEPAPAAPSELFPSPSSAPAQIAPESLPLIPETPEPVKKPKGRALDEPKKKSSTEAAAEETAQRIRFRQMKTRAQNDPAVQAAWDRAEAARSDAEKREALKSYYTLLYRRMAKADATLKPKIALAERTALRRLEQRRVDATEPLAADDRAERLRE